ncbi:type IX secretion system plug protein domain-containing protein [Longimonas halophila]|nr:type IX secretion system plug protein domain-containing protein [Longimonas halophila]
MSVCPSCPAGMSPPGSFCPWAYGLGLLLVLLALLTGGCATSENATSSPEEPRAPRALLAPADSTVRTVQLYRGEDERALPVLSMQGGAPLTLEFDLLVDDGRPLSVYFIHADRTWRRDLTPSQYMQSFASDRLLDYRFSRSTEVPYVHYTYEFPNDSIGFTVSGNYIVRVTEQGNRDAVLFERPFYVSEQEAAGDLELEALRQPGTARAPLRPTLRFTPPDDLQGNPYGYTVCFARDVMLEAPRCSTRPLLNAQPQLGFELDREAAFAPEIPALELDLSNLRTSIRIARVDRQRRPPRVVLDPDRARVLEGEPAAVGGPSVIRDALRGVSDGELSGDYVDVQFALVPPDAVPVQGAVRLNGPVAPEGVPMQWDAQAEHYTATLRIKQGLHAYRYETTDAGLQRVLQRASLRYARQYLTFVYYRDARVGTDRLLQVQTARPPR